MHYVSMKEEYNHVHVCEKVSERVEDGVVKREKQADTQTRVIERGAGSNGEKKMKNI